MIPVYLMDIIMYLHRKLQGGEANDTAAVTFKDVVVPAENLIYKENKGFIPLMLRFYKLYTLFVFPGFVYGMFFLCI